MGSLLVKGGVVATPEGTVKADVLVKGGTIAAIGQGLSADETLDASGKLVLPGGIDAHTHMAMPFGGTVSCDDFADGTACSAFGGITTIIDFAIQGKGTSLGDTVARKRLDADGKVHVDYGLHVAITDLTEAVMAEIPATIAAGVPTFKCFMTYPGMAVDDYTLFRVLKTASSNGGRVSVHAENLSMITGGVAALLAAGKTEPPYHARSRPDYVEAEAVARAIMWAEEAGAELYVVHLSTAKGLELVRAAQARGARIIAETCPQYLTLTDEKYDEPDFGGAKYVMSPPLRKGHDQAALWRGVRNGSVSTLASDHCPFTMEQKKMGLGDFSKIPNGAPGTEVILPVLYSEGVLKGRITLERLVEVFSANPARIFGLPSKGAIEPGKDADLSVFDPDLEWSLGAKELHSKAGYSPFEGIKVRGKVRDLLLRGSFVVKDGRLVGAAGAGKYIARSKV
jgi:dihydropyrimidinase